MTKFLSVLLATSATLAVMSASAMAADMPKKIGYVTNYATHEWYQNVIKGMKDRAAQLGYLLEGIDWRAPIRTQRPELAG